MYNENFTTTITEYDKAWTDKFGLVSGAYEWAMRELKPGHRVIGTRVLPFNNKLDIYKFDIRHHADKGVTVECEYPARCATVIRVNSRQMIVQESDSLEIVQKYIPCMDENGKVVWRLWHKRVYEYHIEVECPAVNYNLFLLQCNQVVHQLGREAGGRDWFNDMKRRVMFSDMRADTPVAVKRLLPQLAMLSKEALAEAAKLPQGSEMYKALCLAKFNELVEYSTVFILHAEAGTPFRR